MIPFIPNPAGKSGGSHRDNHHFQWMIAQKEHTAPATHPIHFAAYFPRQNHRCAAWVVFFFFTNKILCSCSIFQNSFLIVDSTALRRYSCARKKQYVVPALHPAFFIAPWRLVVMLAALLAKARMLSSLSTVRVSSSSLCLANRTAKLS